MKVLNKCKVVNHLNRDLKMSVQIPIILSVNKKIFQKMSICKFELKKHFKKKLN